MLSDRIRDRMVKERRGLINKGAERKIRKIGNPAGMDGWIEGDAPVNHNGNKDGNNNQQLKDDICG